MSSHFGGPVLLAARKGSVGIAWNLGRCSACSIARVHSAPARHSPCAPFDVTPRSHFMGPKKAKLYARKRRRAGSGQGMVAEGGPGTSQAGPSTGERGPSPASRRDSRRSSAGSSSSSLGSDVHKVPKEWTEASPRSSSRADTPKETPRADTPVQTAEARATDVGAVRDEMREALRAAHTRGEMPFLPTASSSSNIFFSASWLKGGQRLDSALNLDA